jgi:hypothetical protein
VWVAAVVGFFLLMSAWALANPLISGPDEPAHVIRAEAIVRGQLIGRPVYAQAGNPNTTVLVPGFLQQANAFRYWCYIFNLNTTAVCAPPLSGPDHLVRVTTYVGHYPPLYYAVVGLPSLAYPGRGGVFVMRLASALVNALLLGTALWLALRRSRLVALAVLVAATPTVIYYSGSVNPNGMEMTAAVCFWCAVLGLTTSWPGRAARVEVVVAAVSGSLLGLARGLSPVWVVIAVGAALLGANAGRLRELSRRRDVLVAGCVLVVVALAAVAWILGEHGLDELGFPNHLSDGWLFIHSLDGTPHYLAEMVGVFGANNIPAPPFATTVVVGSFAVLVAGALVVGSWRQRLVLLALLVGIIAVPIAVGVVSGRHYGLIWQGRYTVAIGVGSPIFAGYVLTSWFERARGPGRRAVVLAGAGTRVQAGAGVQVAGAGGSAGESGGGGFVGGGGGGGRPATGGHATGGPADDSAGRKGGGLMSRRRVSWAVLGVALLLAGSQFTSLLWDLRRFMVGADGPLSGVFSGIWHPPVDGFVLLISAACGVLTLTVLLVWSPPTAESSPAPPTGPGVVGSA